MFKNIFGTKVSKDVRVILKSVDSNGYLMIDDEKGRQKKIVVDNYLSFLSGRSATDVGEDFRKI